MYLFSYIYSDVPEPFRQGSLLILPRFAQSGTAYIPWPHFKNDFHVVADDLHRQAEQAVVSDIIIILHSRNWYLYPLSICGGELARPHTPSEPLTCNMLAKVIEVFLTLVQCDSVSLQNSALQMHSVGLHYIECKLLGISEFLKLVFCVKKN